MKLFEPVKIGNKEIRNRIIMAPMTSHFGENGYVTERLIHFYEERAKGGVGLVTVEDGIVDYPIGNNTDNPISIDDDKYIPMFRKLSNVIKKHGAVPILQLSHAGRRAGQLSRETGCLERTCGRLPVAPSALAHPSPGHVVPIPLTTENIERIIEKFALAAKRTVEAGFEMIGLHCAHMYLCGQFLSPWSNKRTDAYGGSLENRLRFVLSIIKQMKKKVGDDVPIVCRMNGMEPEHGNSLSDLQEIARRLEMAGVSALHISVGFGSVLRDKNFIPAEAPIGMPEGCIVHLAENIRKAVSIPVIAVNKIRHVDFAEKILQEERADMIALGRALLADPEWPVKAMNNRAEDIRPCISCCQGCVGNIEKGKPIACLVNPLMGREKEIKIKRVSERGAEKVLVIGGGPAGLEFAITAAKRGHNVTIWEKEDALGGKLLLAAKPPGKEELQELTAYLQRSAEYLGVEIKLNKKADATAVKQYQPGVVVLATGSKVRMPELEEGINGNVRTVADVLNRESEIGDKVIIIGGGLVGLETAKYLIQEEKDITIIEMLDAVGYDMPGITRVPLLLHLENKGVRILTIAPAKKITREGVEIEYDGKRKFIKGDTVILATGTTPDNDLKEELKGMIPNIYSLGDCRAPGNMMTAIHEGFDTGLQV